MPPCEVCQAEPSVGVASTPLAAMSVAYGRRCLQENAQPLWIVHFTLDSIGGPAHAAEWVKHVRSYKDGGYIDWDAIVACYVPGPDGPVPPTPNQEDTPAS